VRSPDAHCSLHFLFGHLFHAAGDVGQGAEAVIAALSWRHGEFTFNPRATLPLEQTIDVATVDLVAEAERRRAAPGPTQRPRPLQAPDDVTGVDSRAARRAPSPAPPMRTMSWTGRTEVAAPADIPPPRRTGSPTRMDHAGERPRLYGEDVAYPLPTGTSICTGLSSGVVDFAKLLRTLEDDGLTGYIRLRGTGFACVVLLRDGHVLDAFCRDGTGTDREIGLGRLRSRLERGEGVFDVVELRAETVLALHQLITAPPLLTGLLGRFIDFDRLLHYLAEERLDGCLVVDSGTEVGVVLLCKGSLAGAYTSSCADLTESTVAIHQLAMRPRARIEVKGGMVPALL
jgi:Domain of unknown function (DUF4388)